MREFITTPEATTSAIAVVKRFNAAFNLHDADAIMANMTDGCVFESTYPPADGERYEGCHAVRTFWERMFRETPTAHFETEDLFACGDRCVVQWRYEYAGADGEPKHIRGVDLFRVRGDKVAEKLAYVKG